MYWLLWLSVFSLDLDLDTDHMSDKRSVYTVVLWNLRSLDFYLKKLSSAYKYLHFKKKSVSIYLYEIIFVWFV